MYIINNSNLLCQTCGPYHGNRILDLSVGAAKAIGMIEKGVTNVKYEVLN